MYFDGDTPPAAAPAADARCGATSSQVPMNPPLIQMKAKDERITFKIPGSTIKIQQWRIQDSDPHKANFSMRSQAI